MKHNTTLISAAVAGVIALGMAGLATQAIAAEADKEKCAGVAKKGKNDCAANGHACAGQAKRDGDPREWVYLPTGTCERLLNGRVVKEKAKK